MSTTAGVLTVASTTDWNASNGGSLPMLPFASARAKDRTSRVDTTWLWYAAFAGNELYL